MRTVMWSGGSLRAFCEPWLAPTSPGVLQPSRFESPKMKTPHVFPLALHKLKPLRRLSNQVKLLDPMAARPV